MKLLADAKRARDAAEARAKKLFLAMKAKIEASQRSEE